MISEYNIGNVLQYQRRTHNYEIIRSSRKRNQWFRRMPLDLSDVMSTLFQVMTWWCQAASHYLRQYWPRSMSPCGVTRPQWVQQRKKSLVLKVLICCEEIKLVSTHGRQRGDWLNWYHNLAHGARTSAAETHWICFARDITISIR